MSKKRHNPEKRAYKGKSYRRGGKPIRDEKEKLDQTEGYLKVIKNLDAETKCALHPRAEQCEYCR